MSLELVSAPSSVLKAGGVPAIGIFSLISSNGSIGIAVDPLNKTINLVSAGGGTALLNNWTAVTDPTVNDDSGDGYSVGSLWFNTLTNSFFVCEDNTAGAALWEQINPADLVLSVAGKTGNVILNANDIAETLSKFWAYKFTSSNVNPSPANDSSQGYSVGSFWFNSATNTLFIAKSVSVGVAEWIAVSSNTITVDVLDNSTEHVVLGQISDIRQATLEYTYQLPSLNKQITGTIIVSHDGTNAAIIKHEYSYQTTDISGLTYGASILSGNLRLDITNLAVGENAKFSYTKQTKPLF